MTKIADDMHDKLIQLGFSTKEAAVYLALLEFGHQPASVIAKKTGFPRPTVLFLFEHLVEKGCLRKSQKGRTQYFYADPKDLEASIRQNLRRTASTLQETIPLLEEFKNPFTSPPKVTFFEGLEGCRKAYSMILESTTEVYEFAAHNDLLKMGDAFMKYFIADRSRRGIHLHVIAQKNPIHDFFKKRDRQESRSLRMFPAKKGHLYSSIDVFENKVLILNLHSDAFALLIESTEVAETLKTIHHLSGEAF